MPVLKSKVVQKKCFTIFSVYIISAVVLPMNSIFSASISDAHITPQFKNDYLFLASEKRRGACRVFNVQRFGNMK